MARGYIASIYIGRRALKREVIKVHNALRILAVESAIDDFKRRVPAAVLAALLENCFPDTLDSTVQLDVINNRADMFVITGDSAFRPSDDATIFPPWCRPTSSPWYRCGDWRRSSIESGLPGSIRCLRSCCLNSGKSGRDP